MAKLLFLVTHWKYLMLLLLNSTAQKSFGKFRKTLKQTEAISSISYSGVTYSKILKILTIVKYMQAPWKFQEKYDVILITQLKAMFLEISETLKI